MEKGSKLHLDQPESAIMDENDLKPPDTGQILPAVYESSFVLEKFELDDEPTDSEIALLQKELDAKTLDQAGISLDKR